MVCSVSDETHIDEYPLVLRGLVDELTNDTLIVSYEELVADPQAVFRDRMCPFLGVDYRPVTTRLTRRIDRPPEEVIDNWPDVAHLAGETVQLM